MLKTFISALFKKNNASHRKSGGFTIVELMVVIAIIVTISAIVLIDYRSGNDQLALQRSAHKLAQDLRIAQEMAMSSAEVNGVVPHGIGILMAIDGPSSGGPPATAGPLPVSTSTYHIYADNNGDNKFNPSTDSIVREIDLSENRVFISEISVTGVTGTIHRAYVFFVPPDPDTRIFNRRAAMTANNTDPGTGIRITLALESDPSITRVIVVNQAGLIYVE